MFMRTIITMLLLAVSVSMNAQELSAPEAESVSVNELPEYIIVTSENTGLIGGINITIDYKNSEYKPELIELSSLLQSGKKLKVRNQMDLLNAMSVLGFEYIDAYTGRDAGYSGKNYESSKYRTNMVFRKKEQFRK